MLDYKIEICANSVASCLEAQKGGAHRVELCASIPEGGTTPSYATIALARELLNIKLHVIIRPRGGDFLYSSTEHQIMLNDIEIAKKLNADGVVIGCLTPHGDVDMQRNRELMEAAEGMRRSQGFLDMCRNPFESLEILYLGLRQDPHFVETKGRTRHRSDKTVDSTSKRSYCYYARSGINEHNIAKIARETGAKNFIYRYASEWKAK